MKSCPSCNELNEDSAIVCTKCKANIHAQSSSYGVIIAGAIMAIIGLIFLMYGNSQNNNIGSQLRSLFGSGQTNPGTPWMIVGGVALGVGVILVVVKMASVKK